MRIRAAWLLLLALAAMACDRVESRLSAEPPQGSVPAIPARSEPLNSRAPEPMRSGPGDLGVREPVPEVVATPDPDPLCLVEDAGVPGLAIVRFAVRLRRLSRPTNCADVTLNLEIPSRGWTHVLCGSGCGPYRFENRKSSPSLATFSCDADLESVDGTVSIRDGVVVLEAHAVGVRSPQIPIPGVSPPPESSSRPTRPPEHFSVPLGCRSHIMFETSPVARSADDKSL